MQHKPEKIMVSNSYGGVMEVQRIVDKYIYECLVALTFFFKTF